jgi:DNA-nicking Smr family endonuclease
MDFGDILDEWERLTSVPQGKKRRSRDSGATKDSARAQKDEDEGMSVPPSAPPATKAARRQDAPARSVDPLTAWLRIHGVYDKDADAEASATYESGAEAGERRRRLHRKEADATLDLHGLTQDEAWSALEFFFEDSRRQGFEKLRIVHGKGNHSDGESVLKQLARRFIERCPFAGESGHSDAASGGSGATWVLLKN